MFIEDTIIFTMAFVFYAAAIGIHLLTLANVIPFTSINGGRSASFKAQAKQSRASIAVLILGGIVVLVGLLVPNVRETIVYLIVVGLLASMWTAGTVLQLLGTRFERYVVVWINLIGAVSHIALVVSFFR